MVMGVSCTKEQQVGRNRFLGGRPLRRHVRDDNVQYPFQFVLLKHKHLIMQALVPYKLLLIILEIHVIGILYKSTPVSLIEA